MSTQNIRPSQFITTYGPGSIIEGRNGPRLIPSAGIGLFHDPTIDIEDYEISNSRLSQGVLGGARVFRLPSNAELGKKEDIPLYRTKIFPNWNLCTNSGRHSNERLEDLYILYHSSQQRCPICKEQVSKNQQAIRFIVACPEGHLDDFDWSYFIHNGGKLCDHRYWFNWIGGGSSLASIHLSCPKCNSITKSFDQAYKKSWPCHGRFPEREGLKENSQWKECKSRAKIIQRQASNLHINDIVSLFTIPPRDTVLHRILDDSLLKSHIVTNTFSDKAQLGKLLRSLEEKKFVKTDNVNAILDCTWEEITSAIKDIDSKVASNYRGLIKEELYELLKASKEGAPPLNRPKSSTTVLFEVNRNNVKQFNDINGNILTATPISKLSEIKVQLSYRREIRSGDNGSNVATPVNVSFVKENKDRWYPGMELYGEGIFVSTDNGYLPQLVGKRAMEWEKAYTSSENSKSGLFRDEKYRDELNPLFVYLHSLSHSIIRSLSVESGYSSSSLRERIYLDVDSGPPRGGFIIYATQPGSDGTSGGLISLVHSFQYIYNMALDSLMTCSNDPLCIEDHFTANGLKANGSACYGCTLISENSCEHRNLWLDRGLILENINPRN